MKKKMKKISVVLLAGCLIAVACGKENGATDNSGVDSNDGPSYNFTDVAEWLPGTQWTVQRQYNGHIGEGVGWIQFRQSYDENGLGIMISDDCRDTMEFGDGTFTLFGPRGTTSGAYWVEDSLVYINSMPLYQVSIDSMIVYGWHDCTYTADMQQWLFTKIQ